MEAKQTVVRFPVQCKPKSKLMSPRDKFLLEIVLYYLKMSFGRNFYGFTTLANDEEKLDFMFCSVKCNF
jgi:hypothetical protein